MADRTEVLELLRIADLAKQWPNLQPLHDHAMEQLKKAAEEHKKAMASKVEAPSQPVPPTTVRTGGRNG